MAKVLTKSANSVQVALNNVGLQCKVLELPSSTRTALEAASSIGCDIKQIVKSLIFKTQNTHKPVLVLVSGPNQVDVAKIEFHVGECIAKADAEFVKETTGFTIGGIPPLGHKNAINFIYIDQDLINLDEVWAAAGTPNAVFCIKSLDLLKTTCAKVISLSKGEPKK